MFDKILLATSFLFPCNTEIPHTPGTIVVVTGTCSSGKTTLLQSFSSMDQNWELIEEDAIYIDTFNEMIAEKFPEEYTTLSQSIAHENIYNAIRRNELCIQTSSVALEEAALTALNKIHQKLGQGRWFKFKLWCKVFRAINMQITERLHAGKRVIIDANRYTAAIAQNNFSQHNIYSALIYCPLVTAYDRLCQRNQATRDTANLTNKRFLGQLLDGYKAQYTIQSNCIDPLDTHTVDELIDLFEEFDEDLDSMGEENPLFCLQELTHEQLEQLKHLLIPSVPNIDRLVYVQPKGAYDIIINTNQKSPDEAALELLQAINRVAG